MKSKNMAELLAKMYELLEPLDPQERSRLITSTLGLFPDSIPITNLDPQQPPSTNTFKKTTPGVSSAAIYFEDKDPRSKVEELAIAARYREHDGHESHSKDDLKAVFQTSRRPFDSHNFGRDIDNATRAAGFFVKGHAKGMYQLSAYGQKFVDSLPNRDQTKSIRKPPQKNKSTAKKDKA